MPLHFWRGIVCPIHLALGTHGLCRTLCLHLGFLSNSALCVFLSLSLKEITHFMVEAGWRGEWDSSVPPWAPCADPQVGFLQEEGTDFLLVSEVDLHCKEHRMDRLMSCETTFAFLLGEATRDSTYLCGPQKQTHLDISRLWFFLTLLFCASVSLDLCTQIRNEDEMKVSAQLKSIWYSFNNQSSELPWWSRG